MVKFLTGLGLGGARVALVALGVAGCRLAQRPPRSVSAGTEPSLKAAAEAPASAEPIRLAVRRGRALMEHTWDSLPDYVGSSLRCFSCHLNEGNRPGALPLTGVYSRFPQYRSRNGLINLIEDRINDCFVRSMNGKALPRDGSDMRDIVAYLASMSVGIAPPGEVTGQGLRTLTPLVPDLGRGRAIFSETCSRCHGSNGEGSAIAPPVWGPQSFNIGAGMARLRTAAAFIRDNMPNDRAVELTDQQAFDVAGYILSQSRPDLAHKEDDWPWGGAPPDVAYPTRGASFKRSVPKP